MTLSSNHLYSLETTLLIAGILLLFICIFTYLLVEAIKQYKLISRMSVSSLNQLKEGLVAVKGLISPTKDNILNAPLSAHACYWYEYEIEKYNASAENSGLTLTLGKNNAQKEPTWETLKSGRKDNFFVLDDGTSQCLVFTQGADMTTPVQTWMSATLPDNVSASDEADFSSALKPVVDHLQNSVLWKKNRTITIPLMQTSAQENQFRFTEKRLNANETITVLGYFKTFTRADIDTLLQQEENARQALLQQGPRKKDLLLALKNYLLQTDKPSVASISYLAPKKQAYLISSLPDKSFKHYYLKNMLIFIALDFFLVAGGLFFIINAFFK